MFVCVLATFLDLAENQWRTWRNQGKDWCSQSMRNKVLPNEVRQKVWSKFTSLVKNVKKKMFGQKRKKKFGQRGKVLSKT